MASNDYHFITRWRVEGDVREVADILNDPLSLPRWWPSVYLDVWEVQPAGPDGTGRVIGLYTKGWLPYTLRWQFSVSESNYPFGFRIEAHGDFVGRGIWTIEQDGPWVDVTYDWKIEAAMPLLKYGSFAMKPIFSWNHRWAMARGEESMKIELQRRRATTQEARDSVPSPPGPTPDEAAALVLTSGAALTVGTVVALIRARSRRRRGQPVTAEGVTGA